MADPIATIRAAIVEFMSREARWFEEDFSEDDDGRMLSVTDGVVSLDDLARAIHDALFPADYDPAFVARILEADAAPSKPMTLDRLRELRATCETRSTTGMTREEIKAAMLGQGIDRDG